ncbi:hypothetical protein RHMOL_Rhmol04G0364000 [Rhododendron molle]|uniref:Uncharacterized protein n=1 Tax=Rhododendron molle TaxID=49168 RepID=A0ACC0P8I5_RHOML|nr:hypothetical protein RHMOL_Rhmol04G0364000 [Rhododendron molle]
MTTTMAARSHRKSRALSLVTAPTQTIDPPLTTVNATSLSHQHRSPHRRRPAGDRFPVVVSMSNIVGQSLIGFTYIQTAVYCQAFSENLTGLELEDSRGHGASGKATKELNLLSPLATLGRQHTIATRQSCQAVRISGRQKVTAQLALPCLTDHCGEESSVGSNGGESECGEVGFDRCPVEAFGTCESFRG